MLDLLLGVVIAALFGYGVMRLVEYHTLNTLPTLAELFDMPLPKLYRWALRAERWRLRRRRVTSTKMFSKDRLLSIRNAILKLVILRATSLIPTQDYMGLKIANAFDLAVVAIDDVVDDDAEPSIGTRRWFFIHVTRLVEGFSDPASLHESALPEDIALVYTVLAAKQQARFDPVPILQSAWRKFTPDALRIIEGRPVDRKTLDLAIAAYAEMLAFVGQLLGLDEWQAWLFGKLDSECNLMCNRLRGMLDDAQARRLNITEEEFAECAFGPADLLEHASSLEELATVPGLAEWCVSQAEEYGALWEHENMPRLQREVLPYIKPRLARKMFLMAENRRVRLFRWHLHWWKDYLPASIPPGPPPAWLALAEFYEAAAVTLGLPVSEDTKARWRLVVAYMFWLDYLLDDSPDPVRAQKIFERFVIGPMPLLSELPDWPALPKIMAATEELQQAVAGFGSYQSIVEETLAFGWLAPQKAQTDSVFAYIRLLRDEDTAIGRFTADCMSDEERAHPVFPEFRQWCEQFMGTCGVFDSKGDLAKDYRKRLVRVRPGRVNRLVLFVYFRWISLRFIGRHPRAFIALAEAVQRRRAAMHREEV